jgi:hypothetical protein
VVTCVAGDDVVARLSFYSVKALKSSMLAGVRRSYVHCAYIYSCAFLCIYLFIYIYISFHYVKYTYIYI